MQKLVLVHHCVINRSRFAGATTIDENYWLGELLVWQVL